MKQQLLGTEKVFTINCQMLSSCLKIEGRKLVASKGSDWNGNAIGTLFRNESGSPCASIRFSSLNKMRRCIHDELGRTQANCKSIKALLF